MPKKNIFNIYKAPKKFRGSRPEQAGNFDNMDDYNIVNAIDVNEIKCTGSISGGNISGSHFSGDGSALTGITGTGDNLGNHIATQTISGANVSMTGTISGAAYNDGAISHDSIADVSADDHHAQSHNINTHVMGDNKIIHTKAAGAITEIGLGAAGTFLRSAGEGNDMTFTVPTDTTDHTALSNIGTLTHALLETNATALSGAHISLSGAVVVNTGVTSNLSGAHYTLSGAHSVLREEVVTISGAHYALSGAAVVNRAVTDNLSGAHYSLSGATTSHIADASDPHGTLLTQTNLSGANIERTGDYETVSGAYVGNLVFGEGDEPGAATSYTRGTVYIKYTA